MTDPNELIKRHFQYLLDEYGFSIANEGYSPQVMGNAQVVLKSVSTVVKVTIDRSQVFLNLGELSWPEKDWFDLSDVIQLFNPDVKEVYDFSGGSLSNQAYLDSQIKRLALILRQYCEPLLRGNFSMEDEIRNIEKKRVTAMLEHFQGHTNGSERTKS